MTLLAEHVGASASRRQQGIVAQPVVVVDVLVTKGDAENALAQHDGKGMFDEILVAVIGETSGQLLAEPVCPVDFPEQQGTTLAGKVAAAEIGLDPASAETLKCERLLFTLCRVLGRVHALVFALRIEDYSASAPGSSARGMRNAVHQRLRAVIAQGRGGLAGKGRMEDAEKVLESFRRRFCDVSVWTKEVKQRFSKWLNKRRERRGTLWMEKFKSVLVQDGEALRTMALYIDLNPVRAGIA